MRRTRLVTHADDAAPEWQWFWRRLAGAWVPGIDSIVAVGMNGPRPVEFNVRTSITEYYGAEGSIEIQRNRVRYRLDVPPLLLREVTMIHYGWLRANGNRSGTLAGIGDGTNQNVMEWSGGSGEVRRALSPPGAFDGTGIFPSTGAFYQSLASVKTGDQRYYVNNVAGSSYSTAISHSYASLVYGEVGSTDGALEFYWRHRLSCILLGTTTAAEVRRFDGVGRTLEPFIWKRRRAYFIAASGTTYTQSLSGSVSSAGVLTDKLQRAFSGSVSTAGSLSQKTSRAFSGSLSTAGDLAKKTQRAFSGAVDSAGALSNRLAATAYTITLDGAVALAGALNNSTKRAFAGSVAMAGTLSQIIKRAFDGVVTSAGDLLKKTQRAFSAGVATSGALINGFTYRITLSGLMNTAGALVNALNPTIVATRVSYWWRNRRRRR